MISNNKEQECPICLYPISNCQCKYGSGARREARYEVIRDHLYMLSDEQLQHLINVQKSWQISYSDTARSVIYNSLIGYSDFPKRIALQDMLIEMTEAAMGGKLRPRCNYYWKDDVDTYRKIIGVDLLNKSIQTEGNRCVTFNALDDDCDLYKITYNEP